MKFTTFVTCLSVATLATTTLACKLAKPEKPKFVYTGSYNSHANGFDWVGGEVGVGIRAFSLSSDGSLTDIQQLDESATGINPSYIHLSKDKKFLYAVNEQ
eukprot:Pgem_evm1s9893